MAKQPATPYVRLYYQQRELSANVDNFSYIYSEQSSDICTLKLTFTDIGGLQPEIFKDKSEFVITWGYIGEQGISKKIYLKQSVWKYEKDISVDLTFTDKAGDMTGSTSKEVFNHANILDVARHIADKHGLNMKVEIPALSPNDDGVQTLSLSEVEAAFKKAGGVPDTSKSKPALNSGPKNEYGKAIVPLQTPGQIDSAPKIVWDDIHLGYIDVRKTIDTAHNVYTSIPQAGRSDRQFLNEVGNEDPEGSTIALTSGDELIIKKRNFNKKPYRAYEYHGQDGEVLQFSPEYRRYEKSGPASAMVYGGFDKFSKQYFEGAANNINNSLDQAISNFQDEIRFLKGINPASDLGDFVINNGTLGYSQRQVQRMVGPPAGTTFGRQNNFFNEADNTIALLREGAGTFLSVQNGIDILEGNIKDLYNQAKYIYDNSTNNVVDAFNKASNYNVDATLKQNPATLEVQGDINLKVMDIITMLGVMEPHLGNYYIIQAEHEISRGSGYTVRMTLVRDGNAFKFKKALDVRKFGRKANDKVGKLINPNHPYSNKEVDKIRAEKGVGVSGAPTDGVQHQDNTGPWWNRNKKKLDLSSLGINIKP